MGLFGSLFKKRPVVAADDPVFGHITFDRGIWALIPNPPNEEFIITVDAPESGPSQVQREFFQTVRSGLRRFEERARDFMKSRIDGSLEASNTSVYSVEIGSDDECKQARFVLEMSDPDAFVIHRVSFSGSEPVDYTYDD